MSEKTKTPPPRTALEVASALSMTLLLAIDAQIQANAPNATPDELDGLVKLGQRASDLLSECRKLEKAQGQLAAGVTRELVLAWAKQQPRETRARLLTDLIAMDDKRAQKSVLST